jgi:hypothetical protein
MVRSGFLESLLTWFSALYMKPKTTATMTRGMMV